jgi:hypothetical protein
LHAAPLAVPVRDPVTGPQRGLPGPGLPERGLPDGGHRSLPGQPDEAAAGMLAAGRAAAPPVEFGQPGEDQPDADGPRRQSIGGRLAARRPRGRPGRRGGRDDEPQRGARAARSGARASRRRLRLWLWTGAAAVLAAAAAVAATALLMHHNAPAQTLIVPSKLGSYVRRPQLEKQMNAKQLQQEVVAKSAGQASHVVSAVYENNAGVSGSAPPQIILFIGGNLAGVSPSGFISSFTSQFKGAQDTSAGSLGGKAACVNARGSATGSVALCTWADSDTFGVVASQTMNIGQLAVQMRAIRPGVERPAR